MTKRTVHETFKLGYDRINENLSNPPMNDLPNFLGYCATWADSISLHHHTEVRAMLRASCELLMTMTITGLTGGDHLPSFNAEDGLLV